MKIPRFLLCGGFVISIGMLSGYGQVQAASSWGKERNGNPVTRFLGKVFQSDGFEGSDRLEPKTRKKSSRPSLFSRGETKPSELETPSDVAGSNYKEPTSADASYLTSTLDQEIIRLRSRRDHEEEKLKAYQDKERELLSLKKELMERLVVTRKRLQTAVRVQEMLQKDPDIIARGDVADALAPAPSDMGKSAPAIEDDILGMTDVGGWRDAGNASSQQNDVALPAAPSMDASGWQDSTFTAAAEENPSPIAPELPEADEEATLKATVLAMDGAGADAMFIVGAGSREGVKRGMIFSCGGAERKSVLVVTKVYPTYSRAILHPEYADYELKVKDQVSQILTLPGTSAQ